MVSFLKNNYLLLLILIVGAILRWDFTTPHHFVIDSDEAIVGLMAKHIYEGKEIPTFYYGQHYMGSLEAILAAGSFALLGVSNVALKLVPFCFSIAFIVLMYLLALRCAPRQAALLTALLVAIPPNPLVVWSSKARGGFIEVICIGTLALLLSLHWLSGKRPRFGLTFLTGLLLGLGWWVNNQIIFFLPAIGLVFIYGTLSQPESGRIKALFSHGALGITAFLIGGLPFWLYNIEHDFITFEMFRSAADKDLYKHVTGLFSTALPIILGGKRFWQEDVYFPAGTQICLALYGGLFLTTLVCTAKEMISVVRLRLAQRESSFVFLLIFVLSTLTIFSLSSFGYLVQAPRYLLPIYVGIIPIIAYGIYRLGFVIGGFILALILSVNIASSYWDHKAVPGEPFVYSGERVAQDHSELIDWLKSRNYTLVKTNYWIGYRLAFETKEEIRFLMFEEPYQIRIPEYQKVGHQLSASEIPLVLVPSQAKIVRRALEAMDVAYQQYLRSGYVVIVPAEDKHFKQLRKLKPYPATTEEVQATPHGENVDKAIDHDIHTRWGSGEHQHAGMKFMITPKQPLALRGIRLDMGDWPHDYPRSLEIVATKIDGTTELILSREDYQAIRYLQDHELIEFRTMPIDIRSVELRQEGNHPIFDWSIAEFSLLIE